MASTSMRAGCMSGLVRRGRRRRPHAKYGPQPGPDLDGPGLEPDDHLGAPSPDGGECAGKRHRNTVQRRMRLGCVEVLLQFGDRLSQAVNRAESLRYLEYSAQLVDGLQAQDREVCQVVHTVLRVPF